jgi:hypothetical protein
MPNKTKDSDPGIVRPDVCAASNGLPLFQKKHGAQKFSALVPVHVDGPDSLFVRGGVVVL